MERRGQRQGPATRLPDGHSSAPFPVGYATRTPTWGSGSASSAPQLLTCSALEGLKSLQLHRHHHAVEAAQVCGGHYTPEGGQDGGGQGLSSGVAVGASALRRLGEVSGVLFLPKSPPIPHSHLMSRSSSSFAGLSRMASRGLTRSSTPPSCTYCGERHQGSGSSRGSQSWAEGNAWVCRHPPCLGKALPVPRLPTGCLILVTRWKPVTRITDL